MAELHLIGEGDLRIRVERDGETKMYTDADREDGGRGEHLTPTDMVAVAYGNCVLTVLSILAKRMKLDIGEPTAVISKETTGQVPIRITKILLHVRLPKELDEENRKKLEERASFYCPVSQALHPDIEKEMRFSWGGEA